MPQPPLHDRSFEHLPRIDWLVYITDGIGLIGAVFLGYWILLCDAGSIESRIAREALCYSQFIVLHFATLPLGTISRHLCTA